MEAASSSASPETSITENPPMAIVCEQCGIEFKRVQDLGKHRNKHKIDEEVEKLRKAQKAEQVGENVAVQISDEGVRAKALEEAHEAKQAEAKKAVQASDEVVQEKVLEKASKTDQVEEKIPLHACDGEVVHDSSSQHEGPIGTCLFCMKFTHLQLAIDRSSIGRRVSRAISKSVRFRKKQRQLAMAQCRAGCSGNVMGNTDEACNLNTVANTESSSVNTRHDRGSNRIEEEGARIKRARTQREYARTKKRVVTDEFDDRNEELDLTLRL